MGLSLPWRPGRSGHAESTSYLQKVPELGWSQRTWFLTLCPCVACVGLGLRTLWRETEETSKQWKEGNNEGRRKAKKEENVFVPGFVSEITVMHHLYSWRECRSAPVPSALVPVWISLEWGITPKIFLWMLCERLPLPSPPNPVSPGSAVAPVVALLSPLTL